MIKGHIALVVGPKRAVTDTQGEGNYAYVCFNSPRRLEGARYLLLQDGPPFKYALWVRSDAEMHDGSPRSGHSESLLIAVWNSLVHGPGGDGMQPEYVFTEREPCGDECEACCKQLVGTTWNIYFVATYEQGANHDDIRRNARWSVRNFHRGQ